MHASMLEHSGLMVHSGLQLGGIPKYPTKQEQEGDLPMLRHSELGPHGDGTQGFTNMGGSGSGGSTENIRLASCLSSDYMEDFHAAISM